MRILAIALTANLAMAAQPPAATGSIAGCMSDIVNQRIPGTTVLAKGDGLERTARTDDAGCYELKDVPVASYRVTASLNGFINVTRNKVTVAPSTVTRLDFTMRLQSICECVQVKRTLADHLADADAVLYVRISDDEPDGSDDTGYYPHRATVITAVKAPAGRTLARVVVRQNHLPLFDVGQEMIAFLKSAGPETFTFTVDASSLATSGHTYPAMALLVENGRITRAPPEVSRYVGMTAEALLKELRAALQRKR